MTNEQKRLLLKDLCARLPYGIRYKGDGGWGINPYQHTTSLYTILNSEEPLVYLRPMSSMTFKETREFLSIKNGEGKEYLLTTDKQDWLNEHHFDCRGLIKKGIAIEAPEGMYNS